MREEYDLSDVIAIALGGFIIGFILALIINIFIRINHTSNTDLLCGVLSDNSISNSTVVMICSEKK